jgi:lipopolysaccharide export system permease protein
MRISFTLSIYIGRQFLMSFVSLFFLFLLLILLFDSVELLRRTASKPDIGFGMVMEMAILKLPHMGQETFPFAVLFGGMLAFWRLTRSNELVITRGAGVSAWQFMLPVIGIAFLLGVVQITVLNPLASATLTRYELLEARYIKGNDNLLALSGSGLWLRQSNEKGQSVIYAQNIYQNDTSVELGNVVVFMYSGTDTFSGRINAEAAKLEDGFWRMNKAWIYKPNYAPVFEKESWLSTDLTLNKIQDSFAPPETMSFWALPGFISQLQKSGFSAVRHQLHWHTLLAAPFLMCAMVLIAATFTLRQSKRGATTFVIGGGVLTGFLLYFFSDVVFALGLSDSIPIVLAAWTPSGVATLLGLATLLHLEDG